MLRFDGVLDRDIVPSGPLSVARSREFRYREDSRILRLKADSRQVVQEATDAVLRRARYVDFLLDVV